MFNKYYSLTKPGIVYGNALTAVAGFLLASKGHVNFLLLLETIIGICLVIGSACVFNNIIDRDIDRLMNRTKRRVLVTNQIPTNQAILFGTFIGILGFLIIGFLVNSLVLYIGIVAFIDYVIIYGLAKRKSIHGTLIGTIAGAAPIVGGYCAVTGQLDNAAITLFIILCAWQMSHFYSIAIFRLKDYKRAKIPVLPAIKGIQNTKVQIVIYTSIFALSVILLRLLGYVNNFYLVIMLLLSIIWIIMGINGLKISDSIRWARRMFTYSLIVLLTFSVLISVNNWVK